MLPAYKGEPLLFTKGSMFGLLGDYVELEPIDNSENNIMTVQQVSRGNAMNHIQANEQARQSEGIQREIAAKWLRQELCHLSKDKQREAQDIIEKLTH